MTTLLTIRVIQLKRELKATGLAAILIAGLFVFLTYASYLWWQNQTTALYLSASLFISCFLLQSTRRDQQFVYNHIDKPHREIYIEYVALVSPFVITGLFSKNWFLVPLLAGMLWFIPFFKHSFQQKTLFKNITLVLPASNFEWISGFRRSWYYLVPLYILALAFCWFSILSLVLLWLITVTIVSFYNECEQLQILNEGDMPSRNFLLNKFFMHSKYLLFLLLPVLVLNTFFMPDHLLINFLFLCIQFSLLGFAIFYKYSTYEPNNLPYGDNIILSLVSLCSLIPFLLPVPILMAIRYYKKAIANLDHYLHD